jgi:hypothetical protein
MSLGVVEVVNTTRMALECGEMMHTTYSHGPHDA